MKEMDKGKLVLEWIKGFNALKTIGSDDLIDSLIELVISNLNEFENHTIQRCMDVILNYPYLLGSYERIFGQDILDKLEELKT